MVTSAHSCCPYLDARSVLVQNLSGLVDLQKSSLDFIPRLAANPDEGFGSKGRRAVKR